MPGHDKRQMAAWGFTVALVVLLALSVMGDGTWMGGIAMGWMMAAPALFFLMVVYFAYRLGRTEGSVGRLQDRPRGQT